jgi:hypothetical protein
MTQARAFLNQKKPAEAKAKAEEAAKLDPNRYEAYAVLALAAIRQTDKATAQTALDKAIELAPADKKASLETLRETLRVGPSQQSPQGATASGPLQPSLSPAAKRTLEVLKLIVEEADKAPDWEHRHKLLTEFLEKSDVFVRENPQSAQVWLLRAAVALELGIEATGWEAGRRLLGLDAQADDPKTRTIIAQLDRRGWLTEKPPEAPHPPTGQERWTNSLGMIFVPIDEVGGMFAIWPTRVRDFKCFVDETSYNATGGMTSLGSDGVRDHGRTWRDPGFAQTEDDPVVGVNLDDVQAFCRWLTKKEVAAGYLRQGQFYRLPLENDTEWTKAWGTEVRNTRVEPDGSRSIFAAYPWGTNWPPPAGIGNLPGLEAKDSDWPQDFPVIQGYLDNYPRTSPVGKFRPNKNGLYDMIGNVEELMGDEEHYVVGYSWRTPLQPTDFYHKRYVGPPARTDFIGFRCVVVCFDQEAALKWQETTKAKREAALRAGEQAEEERLQKEVKFKQDQKKASWDQLVNQLQGRWRLQIATGKDKEKFKGYLIITNAPGGQVGVSANCDYERLLGYWNTYHVNIAAAGVPTLVTFYATGDGYWQEHPYRSEGLPKKDTIELILPANISVKYGSKRTDGQQRRTYNQVHIGVPARDTLNQDDLYQLGNLYLFWDDEDKFILRHEK